jgi:hypothetical protein
LAPAGAAGGAQGGQPSADARSEASRILTTDLASGEVPAADKTYLAQLIASRAGISQADAEKRVNDVLAKIDQAKQKAQETAEAARKAAITTSLFLVISMLIGAFIASVAALLGGRQRDAL